MYQIVSACMYIARRAQYACRYSGKHAKLRDEGQHGDQMAASARRQHRETAVRLERLDVRANELRPVEWLDLTAFVAKPSPLAFEIVEDLGSAPERLHRYSGALTHAEVVDGGYHRSQT